MIDKVSCPDFVNIAVNPKTVEVMVAYFFNIIYDCARLIMYFTPLNKAIIAWRKNNFVLVNFAQSANSNSRAPNRAWNELRYDAIID